MTITQTAAWRALETHSESLAGTHLRALFADDPERAKDFSLAFDGILFDFSKQRLHRKTLALLVALAEEAGVSRSVARMFAGERINVSEDRAVLHVALRRSAGPFPRADFDVMPEVLETRRRMAELAERLRFGNRRGHTGSAIRDVVNIGIGGSDLGPKMLARALRSIAHPTLRVHFVSNLDGAQLAPMLQTLDPRTTLFIVASKTFTTQETMLNARTARDWLVSNLGTPDAVASHFAAVTSKSERALEFGIAPEAVFPLWDWVGGRFSLWSAVGLALMIAIGPHAFDELLGGAEYMDEHFRTASFDRNLPVVMALIGIWNTNFLGAATNAVLPYNESLQYFPAFLQQLEMESNGKAVGIDGRALGCASSPIVWGELGNNGQHAFFQLLHQGGRLVPCEFIAAAHSDYPLPGHHDALLANCFAQSAALAFGRTAEEARAELKADRTVDPGRIESLVPQKTFPGNQPSTTLLLSRLDSATLGALVALYEHKVTVQGLIWGINSFDQWGVELGKEVAHRVLAALRDPGAAQGLDASTRNLIEFTRRA
ncbi:MAG: glucose-6-phosphate isomerase [Betaproteobacteria bacterium RBG_16_64_18]|nr:MAG: glucose-6-phosphate isomerase [Betaproteobacteria bacterium RBG_16_64_18]